MTYLPDLPVPTCLPVLCSPAWVLLSYVSAEMSLADKDVECNNVKLYCSYYTDHEAVCVIIQ